MVMVVVVFKFILVFVILIFAATRFVKTYVLSFIKAVMKRKELYVRCVFVFYVNDFWVGVGFI